MQPISRYNVRLRNDLYCVGWGVKLYSLTPAITRLKFLTDYIHSTQYTDEPLSAMTRVEGWHFK